MICSACGHSHFVGFRVLCALTGELLWPETDGCSEATEKDKKVQDDEGHKF